jgi:beta-galactosidase
VIVGYEASLACWRPGNAWAQDRLVRHALGKHRSPYACRGALVYRLAAPTADHYFVMNDGEAKSVKLEVRDATYRSWEDPVAEKRLKPGAPIALPRHGALWIRCARSGSSV